MSRKLTASTTLDNLRKEAKRWLKALRENNADARRRFDAAFPDGPSAPALRDVQHALAREHAFENWTQLKQALAARLVSSPEVGAVDRFLEYACPDHHIRGLTAHEMAGHAAMRILEQNPSLPDASIYTAVVCGEKQTVERLLREQPELANAKRAASGPDRSGSGRGSRDVCTASKIGAKGCEIGAPKAALGFGVIVTPKGGPPPATKAARPQRPGSPANLFAGVERGAAPGLELRGPQVGASISGTRGVGALGPAPTIGSYDFLGDLGGKNWEPLLFLCGTRLPLEKANRNAVEIARLLLDHGADPNARFFGGDSPYTPLVLAIGEGEENRPPHPRRDELVRLLLERGAEPYDGKVIYNIHFQGKVLWWLKLMHEFSLKAGPGRAADWADPEWHMLDQGNYGSGARWHLRTAIEKNDVELAQWCLEHGANANAAPEKDRRFPQFSLYEHAVRLRRREIAELLVRRGAVRQEFEPSDEDRWIDVCLSLDREEAQSIFGKHPEYLRSPAAIFAAAREDRADAVALLLDLGTPIEVADAKKQRTLHVAAAHDATKVAALLIERGAEIDPYEENYGNTPFDFAVYHQYPRMIDLLRPHSHDVWSLTRIGDVGRLRDVLDSEPRMAKTFWQTTPLFWLPEDEEKALEIVQLFLKHGADASFRSKKDGSTAADVARKRGMRRAAELLESTGGLSAPDDSDARRKQLEQEYRQAAADMVSAFDGDVASLERLNRHYGRSFTREDLGAEIWRRVYAFRQRSSREPKRYLKLEEAEIAVAQDAGHSSWSALMQSAAAGAPPQGEPYVLNAKGNGISPRWRISAAEWDELIAVMKERRIPALDASGFMTDAVMKRVAGLEHVTSLSLGGSRELSEEGLLQLAQMPQLEHLNLSEYPGGKLTDRGLQVLRHLPKLKRFEMTWQTGITDAGAANLRYCDRLESVNLMGSPTGDGAIAALQGKPKLRFFNTGRLVSDAGLPLLRNIPLMKHWDGHEGARLLIDGPFTNAGLAGLAGLEGVADLDLFWHVTGITTESFANLAQMPNLQSLGCDGKLSDDTAMRHIAAIPKLRKLRAQESAATDDGFVALAQSQTLERFWGRDSPSFGNRGFVAFSKMPSLHGMGVSLKNVDDAALSILPEFPALRELTPIGLRDDGFRHVGKCARLERLSCMYCRESGDAATEHIRGLGITYYYAGLTQITDRSLEILGGMESLEQVEFYECLKITDAGVPFLTRLPRLREAHFSGSPGVTLVGTGVFRPGVQVHYST